jgi:long-chain fatty acid transport protein
MKRTFAFRAILPLLFLSGVLNAQMDNLANLSAKWIRTNVRNASLDGGADMVNFNPAGLALLNNGIYLSLSNQTLFRKPQHSFNMGLGETSYEQDGIDPVLPMFYAAFKTNKLAFSSGVYISGGGGTVDFPKGSVNTSLLGMGLIQFMNTSSGTDYTFVTDQSLKASSFYLTIPLAVSFAINDKIALSAGARYIRGINNTKASLALTGSATLPDYSLDVNYKSIANGFGGVFGIDFAPTEKLNIAIHYETRVKLEFEAADNKGTYVLAANGEKSRRDLSAVLNTGITYKVTDNFMAGVDFNWYFQKGADWGNITDPRTTAEKSASKVAGDCYTANAGLIYQLNQKLEISGGFSYTAFLYDDKELYYTQMGVYETLKNNNFNVGLGLGYKITGKIEVDLGIGRTFWKDYTINALNAGTLPVKTTDKAYVLAIGVDFRL